VSDGLVLPRSDSGPRLLKRILLDIAKEVRVDRRLNGDLNNLQLLKDAVSPEGQIRPMTRVSWKHHPQLQLLLERRDRYLKIEQEIAGFKETLQDWRPKEDCDYQAKAEAYQDLARLRKQQDSELEAMELCLKAMRKEGGTRTMNLTMMLNSAAKLSESRRQHNEKLEAAKYTKGGLNQLISQLNNETDEEEADA